MTLNNKMSKVKLVDKKVNMKLSQIIKFQLITHCYVNDLTVSESDFNCLTLLGYLGESDLTEFCNIAASKNIFKTTQTVRNCLVKMERNGLIYKHGKSKKRISINPDIKVQTSGNILLNYKLFHIDTQEVKGVN